MRLERRSQDASERPRPSALRLTLLIIAGYGFLLAIVAVFVAEVAFLVWGLASRRPLIGLAALFVGASALRVTWKAIRALVFRIPEPQGVRLTSAEAPALYRMIDEVRREVAAPSVNVVIVQESCNASAVASGGFFGFGGRRMLVLGFPLFAMLAPEQLRVVVAHELSHFSRAHGRFARWVFRSRTSWMRLVAALNERRATPLYVYWLIRWYVPRLDAYSSPRAREQEFEVDRMAAGVGGSRMAADTLVSLDVGARQLETAYWPTVFRAVGDLPDPPRPFEGMLETFRIDGEHADSQAALERLLGQVTEPYDTHPSLRERLEQLGETARVITTPTPAAGETYVEPGLRELARRLDSAWQDRVRAEWRRRHDEIRGWRARLEALGALSAPSPAELFERAEMVENLEGADAALPLYRASSEAGYARGALSVGRILLDRGDEDGVALIEDALSREEALVPEGCEVLIPYYLQLGRELEAKRCEWRAARYRAQNALPVTV